MKNKFKVEFPIANLQLIYTYRLMFIEWLEFKIAPELREKFVEKDREIWTNFLAKQDSFIKKEVWINPAKSEEVITIIYWENREQWKAIPQTLLKEIQSQFDAEMGSDNYQMVTSKEYQVRQLHPSP